MCGPQLFKILNVMTKIHIGVVECFVIRNPYNHSIIYVHHIHTVDHFKQWAIFYSM